jgi:hypothetical protein
MKKVSKNLQLLLFSLTLIFLAATILQVLANQPPNGSLGNTSTRTDSALVPSPFHPLLPKTFIPYSENNIGNTQGEGLLDSVSTASPEISNNPKNPSILTPGRPPY